MPPTAPASEDGLRRALFAGYADRLARRRPGAADRVTLASGHGATLARESGVRDGEFLVALDVRGADRHGVAEARIHLASQVDPEWITPTAIAVEHTLDEATGQVRARRVARVDALVLSETPVPVVPEAAAAVLAEAWLARGPGEGDAELLRRLRFAGLDVDLPALVAPGRRPVPDASTTCGLSRPCRPTSRGPSTVWPRRRCRCRADGRPRSPTPTTDRSPRR